MGAVSFPAYAVPSDSEPRRPLADVVFLSVLAAHPALAAYGLTVEFADEPSAMASPWLRVGVVRRTERTSAGEDTPVASIDVYADDALLADEIAATIARVWPYLRKVRVADSYADGFISGGWVEVDPVRIPEPVDDAEGTPLSRSHVEVGLRLHPAPKE